MTNAHKQPRILTQSALRNAYYLSHSLQIERNAATTQPLAYLDSTGETDTAINARIASQLSALEVTHK